MKVFAIGDPHLSFKNGVLTKPMSIFGAKWEDHAGQLRRNWEEVISAEDVVFVVGDISWATKPAEVAEDLAFLERLPGQKVLIRGNHDYWWSSLTKVRNLLPPSCKAINGDVLEFENFVVGGTRLWDLPELSWKPYFKGDFQKKWTEADADILKKETIRLEQCIELLRKFSLPKFLLLHYPPTTPDLINTYITSIISKGGIDYCVFGHLHDMVVADGKSYYGSSLGVEYHLVSCDWVDFRPRCIAAF